MRSETEVLNEVLSFAREDENVRAVLLNGSRVNPKVTKDLFCDFDVAFFVSDTEAFQSEQSWIKRFGELVIMQQNPWSEGEASGYIYLMQFMDGVRIDLAIDPVEHLGMFLDDSLTSVLLDKDKRVPELPPPSDATHHTKRPSRKEFDEVTNEFWWCSTNVAKGIWRDELSHAKWMYQVIVRECMIKLLSWYIGMKHDWKIDPGDHGKWFKKLLPVELWESYQKTYAGADYGEMWEALFEAGRLSRKIGVEIAQTLGYAYPMEEDRRVSEYLSKVSQLSKDATSLD